MRRGRCPQPSRGKVSTMRSRQLALPLVFACHNFVAEEDRERKRVCTLRLPFVSLSQHRHQSSSMIVPPPSMKPTLPSTQTTSILCRSKSHHRLPSRQLHRRITASLISHISIATDAMVLEDVVRAQSNCQDTPCLVAHVFEGAHSCQSHLHHHHRV